ncbi:Rrf2 family transcriptional regulator [Parvibaculum sp.]|jgi:Rrf2 family transcriptional regulator, nitric oxide-sensitive transcriptional repressor|uniref:Rrf2 family transcriptional regulator n=1 Tax=Parvibaculum sp. TaxID=2024848 RepID=UPI001B26EE58|nr:Rrf2 family transcriptional regulator [Parvibaculum sp.]MBO6634602.1 Rrf2 family transcriptional regulator [Parvibaculum sp.]MBO6680027.1 Rrf2 family transcriptional regulator [Parvibaculum sp.]MBO6683645.1 Rrf2 family transcriptional regulator [Parvibaculum sp.]MBO6905168.1 Rrf2 family transcriptional regulator [Parvibaculum sp.]
MRLTLHTDYALRLLMHLAVAPDRLVTIAEVSEAFAISRNHLVKVAHELGKAGFVETTRGRGGGLRLAHAPERIVIGDVVRAMEEDFRIVECFDREANTCCIAPACRLKRLLRDALDAWLAVLDEATLADLVARPAPLRRLLSLTG